jgi:hypothetical protein
MVANNKSKALKAILSWAILLLISQIQVLAATQAEIKELTTGWSVNAKSKGSTRDSAETMKMRTWQTNSTTLSSSMEGSIRLSQSARAPRQVSILILWVGFDMGTKKQALIKEDTQEIEVPPGVEKTFEFNSGEVSFKKVKDWRAKETTEGGAKLQGWVVMLREVTSNGVIAVKSSMSGLEKFVTSPGELEKLKTGSK